MATITLDIDNSIDTREIIATISNLKGIKKIELKPKTKTEELLEKMERGEYVSDDEYLRSIPGFMEALDEEDKVPLEECVPYTKDIWNKI
jgi:hypothetical protein